MAEDTLKSDLESLREVLNRIAEAADKDLPGIDCERISKGDISGMRFDVAGFGKIDVMWREEYKDKESYSLKIEGIDPVFVSAIDVNRISVALLNYYNRMLKRKEQELDNMKKSAFHSHVEGLKKWDPKMLEEKVKKEKERYETDFDDNADGFFGP